MENWQLLREWRWKHFHLKRSQMWHHPQVHKRQVTSCNPHLLNVLPTRTAIERMLLEICLSVFILFLSQKGIFLKAQERSAKTLQPPTCSMNNTNQSIKRQHSTGKPLRLEETCAAVQSHSPWQQHSLIVLASSSRSVHLVSVVTPQILVWQSTSRIDLNLSHTGWCSFSTAAFLSAMFSDTVVLLHKTVSVQTVPFAASLWWNELPNDIRAVASISDVSNLLKTHLLWKHHVRSIQHLI